MEVTVKMTYEEACYLARLVGRELRSSIKTNRKDPDYINARDNLIDRLLFAKEQQTISPSV